MKRQITIYESAKNGKLTILDNVECSTLGDLKKLLKAKDIDYTNKEFVEGVTNTKLLADDSRLPENIPFKGKVTNNLFINILNKDNKIKSGVDYHELSRSDLLKAAKPYANNIQEKFNANYTRVKSSDIADFLASMGESNAPAKESENAPEATSTVEQALLFLAKKIGVEKEVVAILNPALKEAPKKEAKPKAAPKPKEPESFFSKDDISGFIRK